MSTHSAHGRAHTAVVTYFPMFIAVLSLFTSIFQGYLFARSLDIIQRNVVRAESMRTCRDIIDAFQLKMRYRFVATAAARVPVDGAALANEEAEAANAVSRFGALATYLANFDEERNRVRYTELATELAAVLADMPRTAPAAVEQRFAKADKLFAALNADCVHAATLRM